MSLHRRQSLKSYLPPDEQNNGHVKQIQVFPDSPLASALVLLFRQYPYGLSAHRGSKDLVFSLRSYKVPVSRALLRKAC